MWNAVAIALQALWAIILIAISLYLLVHTPRSPEHTASLRLTGVMFGLPGLLAAAGCVGLWRQKRWGWWLCFVVGVLIAAVFIYAVIDDARYHIVDETLICATILASFVPLYLLLPPVRRGVLGLPK